MSCCGSASNQLRCWLERLSGHIAGWHGSPGPAGPRYPFDGSIHCAQQLRHSRIFQNSTRPDRNPILSLHNPYTLLPSSVLAPPCGLFSGTIIFFNRLSVKCQVSCGQLNRIRGCISVEPVRAGHQKKLEGHMQAAAELEQPGKQGREYRWSNA